MNQKLAFLALFTAARALAGACTAAAAPVPVTPPPESFFSLVRENDREAAREFYKKHIDIGGMSVAAAAEVDEEALRRTREIVTGMLAGRPDVLQAMVSNKMYLIVIGKDQVYTDMPEYRNHPNPAFQNERVRGTGGRPTSFGEENVLSLPIDRYDDESIGVHEFCHTIDSTLRSIDPGWAERRNAAYRKAMDKGLWRNSYAASNPGEFWAEICQSYFDCNRVNNWNHGPVGTREQLKVYDPESYELVRSTFRLAPSRDWRYTWLRRLPNVTAPPAKFNIDPYYTKFSWAREFPVLGREASEEALLKANDIIRKMFAYRHDILKALIQDGARLVVLGRNERISNLPEFQTPDGGGPDFDSLARLGFYSPATKILVVGEENVLGDPSLPLAGDCFVIRLFAHALHAVTASRPVDPNWENRGQETQQYELRVQRLDVRFGRKLEELHQAARGKELWKGTPAWEGPAEYWMEGVLAYFDATGETSAPPDAPFPIRTRDALQRYDPGLFALVRDTMAYEGRVDWRRRPPARR